MVHSTHEDQANILGTRLHICILFIVACDILFIVACDILFIVACDTWLLFSSFGHAVHRLCIERSESTEPVDFEKLTEIGGIIAAFLVLNCVENATMCKRKSQNGTCRAWEQNGHKPVMKL